MGAQGRDYPSDGIDRAIRIAAGASGSRWPGGESRPGRDAVIRRMEVKAQVGLVIALVVGIQHVGQISSKAFATLPYGERGVSVPQEWPSCYDRGLRRT